MAAKLMTITIKVEPPALGPVLLKLKELPGIAEFHFDISDSKAGNGEPATGRPVVRIDEIAMALLIKGPVSTAEIMRGLVAAGHKGTRGQAFGVMHILRKKGIAKAVEKGVIELTDKARKSIAGHEDTALRLLPKPKAAKKANGTRKPTRASPGVAQKTLLQVLAAGPAKRPEIRAQLVQHGISEKSIEGVIFRARNAGFVKLDDGVSSLTARGKTELEKTTGEQVNG